MTRSEPAAAETAIEDLSDLFRAALNNSHEQASLGDEITLAHRYLNIEKLRLGDRLSVVWDMEAVPKDVRVPPLILQPLLENAVRALLFGRKLAENLWTPLATLLRAAGRLGLTLLTALADAIDSLGSLEPWFVGTAALCTLMMATSVLLVVGRDIGRHRVAREDSH